MSEWKMVRLGDVCEIARGGSPRPINDYITTAENGINWIKIGDTSSDSKYIEHTEQKIKPEGMKKSRYVHSGDFILSNSMSFGRPYILKIDGCIHDGWLVLQNIQNDIDKDYLYSVLSSPSTYHQFEKMAVGGVVNNLNSDKVKELFFPLPSLVEQKRIAAVLDKCKELITKNKQLLEKYDTLVKSRFIEMLTKWKKCYTYKSLDYYIDSITYGFTNPMPDANEGPWKITAKDIINGRINYSTARKTNRLNFDKLTSKSKPDINDILITKDGTLGRVALVDKSDICINQSVASIKCTKKILPQFLSIMLQIPEYQNLMKKDAGGGTIKHIYITKLARMNVLVPPIDEQQEIVNFKYQIDKSKFAVQKSLEKAETLYKSLMQEYFG